MNGKLTQGTCEKSAEVFLIIIDQRKNVEREPKRKNVNGAFSSGLVSTGRSRQLDRQDKLGG